MRFLGKSLTVTFDTAFVLRRTLRLLKQARFPRGWETHQQAAQ